MWTAVSKIDAKRKRRADAEQSATTVLDAAVALLAERPDASMSELAAAAGVSRQTVYAHYRSREELLGAVGERALADAVAAIDAADLDAGPADEALDRLVRGWWAAVARYARVLEALATAGTGGESLHEFHQPILERLERLARRGQRSGAFARGLSPRWLAASFLGLVHAAAAEVVAGRAEERAAADALAVAARRLFGVGQA